MYVRETVLVKDINYKQSDFMFLSCRIRVLSESTVCSCLNVKNSLLETGAISES